MDSQRKRMLSRSRSGSRSRSVTPGPSSRRHEASLLQSRRQLIMGLANASSAEPTIEPEPRLWLPPPPRSPPQPTTMLPITGLSVNLTPGGSMRVTNSVALTSTPRGSIKKKVQSLPIKNNLIGSYLANPLEKAAACDLDEEDGDEAVKEHFNHVGQYVCELPRPESVLDMPRFCRTPVSEVHTEAKGAASAHVADVDTSQPGPSGIHGASLCTSETVPCVSGRTRRRSTETDSENSYLDTDFDDEFNLEELAASGGMSRNIPDDDDLDDPDIINLVEKAMDEAFDQLDGVSTNFEWTADFGSFQGVPEIFSGPTPGPIEDYDTPYDAFKAIWDEGIIEHIVKETNRYAIQVIEAKTAAGTLPQSSRLHRWTATDKDEMYLLFAIFIYMGLDPRTSQIDFWKSTGDLEMHKFRQLMQYNRFILLNKFLHFQDNSGRNRNLPESGRNELPAKLRKLAPIVGHLNDRFSTLYRLHPDIAIDESLTLFKGRLSWIQAIRSKAARFGIKSFELCESKTGYLYKFEIYTGKNSDQIHAPAPTQDLAGKSAQVVLDLLTGLENRGHCVTMDNFYNSPALARYLKSRGFDCLGTLRPNRKHVPLDIKNVSRNVAKGTIIARHCGDVSCIAWKDTKMVTMISTYHNSETFVGRKAGKALVKPIVVRDYNNTMGGVDLKDQKLSMYLLERKRCVKWYMKMFKRLLNVSVLNAFIILSASLKRRNIPILTHRQFREQLAESLVREHKIPSQEISAPVEELTRLRMDILHVPKKHDRTERKRCVVCLRKGIDKKVLLSCKACGDFLCYDECWTEWHSQKELPGKDYHRRVKKRRE